MHGAGGGAPKGNRNAWRHGRYSAEAIYIRRHIRELAQADLRLARLCAGLPALSLRQSELSFVPAGTIQPGRCSSNSLPICFSPPVQRTSARRLALFVVAAAGALLASSVAYGSFDTGVLWGIMSGGFARVAFSFFFDVLLYRFWQSRPCSVSKAMLLPILASLAIVLALRPSEALALPIALAAAIVLFPAIVYLGAGCKLTGALSTRVARLLGSSSYALYVIHWPLYHAAGWAAPDLVDRASSLAPWSGLVFVALAFWLAVGLERYFHEPIRRFVLRRGFSGFALRSP
jgi:peptidoglycan/LPS O-acetylase OafA/YrhL